MVARGDVAERADVRRQRAVVPAGAAEQERARGRQLRRAQEELLHARLAVREAIAEEGEVAREPLVALDGVVRLGVERVVDGHAVTRAERPVALHDGIAAAVGEDEVVARHQRAERVVLVRLHARERRGRVDVPEDGRARAELEHGGLELGVEHADAAGLHDHVRTCGAVERLAPACRLEDDDLGPAGIVEVAVLLALVGVRLEEGDAVPALVERADEPAVVRRRAVPVGRDEAGGEPGDPHAAASSGRPSSSAQIARSSSTRCAQVCRARIVSSPCDASDAASTSSCRTASRAFRISAPSRARR